MKGHGLSKLYAQLTDAERFQLVTAARARGDSAEADRLRDACPRMAGTLYSWPFSQRCETAADLGMALLADTAKPLAWLDLLSVLGPLVADLEDAPLPRAVCGRAGTIAAARARAVREAFETVCREDLGLDGATVLRGVGLGVVHDRFAAHAAWLDAATRDEALYRDWLAAARELWQRAVQSG